MASGGPRPPRKRAPTPRAAKSRTPPAAAPPAGAPPAATAPASTVISRTPLPGPGALAGRLLYDQTFQRIDLDDRTRAIVEKTFGPLLPGQVVAAGTTGAARALDAEELTTLVRSAAVTAAGLDPAKTSNPPPRVLWTAGASRLLVDLADVQATLSDGLIELTLTVSCDQTGDAQVTVTFLTGTPDATTGGVAATETHPRGPSVIVENWHEALVAFGWNIVVTATSALSGAAATDQAGRALVTNALAVSADELSVLPMGRHAFFAGGQGLGS